MKKDKTKQGKTSKPLVGFIGQGWIGKNYADNFLKRGFQVVRFAKEDPYAGNKEKIKEVDIVFVAVPTPTTPKGFDDSIVRSVMSHVGKGKTAVIKSTILPGTTESIQKEYPYLYVMHSPEFLTEATAAYDAAHPDRNIIGIPVDSKAYRTRAQRVIDILPKAPMELICSSREAELIKYGGNCWFYTKVLFINMLYDLSQKVGADWKNIHDGLEGDSRIGSTHLDPVHKKGRGAGGHCFIKDFAAFRELYEKLVKDSEGVALLRAFEEKNIQLLVKSKKDLDLLERVYGGIKNRK